MSRIGNIFGSSTFTVNPINRSRNYTIEDVNAAIIDGDEVLVFEAINSGMISVNQTLTRDPYRNTLLHTAIFCRNIKIIKKLIECGADLKIKNKFGESCSDTLSKSGLGEAVQFISDINGGAVDDLKKEVKEKNVQIKVMEESLSKLENTNNRLVKEKQESEIEIGRLRKRKVELEETNGKLEETNRLLRQASKKPRN